MVNEIGKFAIVSWILEFAFLLCGVSTLGVFINKTDDVPHQSDNIHALTYGLSVIIASLVCLSAIVTFHLSMKKSGSQNKTHGKMVFWSKIILGFLLLTVTCVLANTHTNYDNHDINTSKGHVTFCRLLKNSYHRVSCDYLVVASTACFFASFVLIVEAIHETDLSSICKLRGGAI
ncbi:uncharacterized protein LOC124437296 [Xenia sp. Carnegie-2017]|uniref:uncharacterized protein LOC124437296 n=1 Tax=Xenia sp. Carnegie-2017 TaxID=2897299 RepID=UPI001F04C983|nr:uncharacterized protein LOC124437296 [Xenia sp. Carnegie-2017]